MSEDVVDLGRQLLALVRPDSARALDDTGEALAQLPADNDAGMAILHRVERFAQRDLGGLDGRAPR